MRRRLFKKMPKKDRAIFAFYSLADLLFAAAIASAAYLLGASVSVSVIIGLAVILLYYGFQIFKLLNEIVKKMNKKSNQMKLTVSMVRNALMEVLEGYSGSQSDVRSKTDEQLLKTDLSLEYGLDSLDFIEMIVTIHHQYGINIDERGIEKSEFGKDPTVENFIKMGNRYRIKT